MSQALTLYLHRSSPVHRLHPLTKLTLTGFLLVSGLTLPGIGWTYVLFGLVLLPLALMARVLPELIARTFKVAFPFAISVFLIQGFLWPGGTPIIQIGPLSLKMEGLSFAIMSTGRILIVVGSFLWFALTTRPDTLMISLAQRGLPPSLAYLIVTTIHITPRFQARAATILDAQRARGLETEGSFRQRVQALLPLAVPLILSSLIDVEERALAIEARAFNHPGPKTSLIEIPEAAWEPAIRWGLILLLVAGAGLRIWLFK